MHSLVPRPPHPNFCHLQHYGIQQTQVRRPEYEAIGCILAAQNCGRPGVEGSQPVRGSFGHTPVSQSGKVNQSTRSCTHSLNGQLRRKGGRGGSLGKMLQTSSSVRLVEGGIDDVLSAK